MKLVVRKSVADEYFSKRKPKVYISFSYREINKAFNSSVHPRDSQGRFTYKGVMELTEQEREELLDYLEKEKYKPYKNFHVSEDKLNDFLANGKWKSEFDACEILANQGYDIYLLDNKYVGGKKSDTFYKKPNKRGFMELKETEDKATTQYNRSVEQAESCFLSITQDMTRLQFDNLKKAVNNNKMADEVLIYYRNKVIRIK